MPLSSIPCKPQNTVVMGKWSLLSPDAAVLYFWRIAIVCCDRFVISAPPTHTRGGGWCVPWALLRVRVVRRSFPCAVAPSGVRTFRAHLPALFQSNAPAVPTGLMHRRIAPGKQTENPSTQRGLTEEKETAISAVLVKLPWHHTSPRQPTSNRARSPVCVQWYVVERFQYN